MKRILLFILAMSCMSTSFATQLTSFKEIHESLLNGHNIKMVINFDYCNPKPPTANIVVYTSPTAVMLRTNYLQFANSPLTTNNPNYPQRPVLENCTYKITDKDEVTIITRVITLPDYEIRDETSSICPLKTAVRVFN